MKSVTDAAKALLFCGTVTAKFATDVARVNIVVIVPNEAMCSGDVTKAYVKSAADCAGGV